MVPPLDEPAMPICTNPPIAEIANQRSSPTSPSGSRQTEAEASNRQPSANSSGSPSGVHPFSMDHKQIATSVEAVEVSPAEFPQQTGKGSSSPRTDETIAGQTRASENTFTQSLSPLEVFNTISGGAMKLDKIVHSERNGEASS